MFPVMKAMTIMFVMAMMGRITAARMIRFLSSMVLSQTNIQARLRIKLMFRVAVTAGVKICGFMYNLKKIFVIYYLF